MKPQNEAKVETGRWAEEMLQSARTVKWKASGRVCVCVRVRMYKTLLPPGYDGLSVVPSGAKLCKLVPRKPIELIQVPDAAGSGQLISRRMGKRAEILVFQKRWPCNKKKKNKKKKKPPLGRQLTGAEKASWQKKCDIGLLGRSRVSDSRPICVLRCAPV